MKICNKCNVDKLYLDFAKCKSNKDGLQYFCKTCRQQDYHINRERDLDYSNKYYESHTDDKKLYKQNNLHEIKTYQKQYQIDNRISLSAYNKFKRQTDIQFRLADNLRVRQRSFLKGKIKNGSAVKDLGCSIEFLKNYLEQQWMEGMSWNNYGKGLGKWSLDHIVALSTVDMTDLIQYKKVSHYLNLRPLWNKDQLKIYHNEQKLGA